MVIKLLVIYTGQPVSDRAHKFRRSALDGLIASNNLTYDQPRRGTPCQHPNSSYRCWSCQMDPNGMDGMISSKMVRYCNNSASRGAAERLEDHVCFCQCRLDLAEPKMIVTHRVLQSTVMSRNGEAPRNLPCGLTMLNHLIQFYYNLEFF